MESVVLSVSGVVAVCGWLCAALAGVVADVRALVSVAFEDCLSALLPVWRECGFAGGAGPVGHGGWLLASVSSPLGVTRLGW